MKKCKEGHYYCYKDSKCKPIPKGYRRGVGGYLRREREDEQEDSKKNGNGKSNGSSNGNGNGGNGGGNGNGSSGGNGGGNGSGGIGENVEIQNSDGQTTAIVVDIIGPAHMKPMVNNSGVWKGTEISERKMTEDEKEKKEDIVKGMKKDKKGFKKRYGKDAKSVMYATATKLAMEEKHKDHEPEMIRNQLKTAKRASKRIKKHTLKKDNFKAWVQSKITKATDYLDTAADYLDSKDDMKEELNKKDKPYIKKLVKNLRKGSKTHAKQADKLEKAIKEGAIDANKFSGLTAIPKLPGLGGGGGGTNAITSKSQAKSLGKRMIDIGKLSTVPARFLLNIKSPEDPQSKFASPTDGMKLKDKISYDVSKSIKDFKKGQRIEEESNPRIPRKKGQPANSKKHSDLYTDENPKGTIHGLGFKDVATAKASVSKIRGSSRSHAHKIQAAVAMEQRAREMGKTSEAAVYRKFINSMKKKTKN